MTKEEIIQLWIMLCKNKLAKSEVSHYGYHEIWLGLISMSLSTDVSPREITVARISFRDNRYDLTIEEANELRDAFNYRDKISFEEVKNYINGFAI